MFSADCVSLNENTTPVSLPLELQYDYFQSQSNTEQLRQEKQLLSDTAGSTSSQADVTIATLKREKEELEVRLAEANQYVSNRSLIGARSDCLNPHVLILGFKNDFFLMCRLSHYSNVFHELITSMKNLHVTNIEK